MTFGVSFAKGFREPFRAKYLLTIATVGFGSCLAVLVDQVIRPGWGAKPYIFLAFLCLIGCVGALITKSAIKETAAKPLPTSLAQAVKNDPTFLDVYNAYRARIVHEDNLVNDRMTWMLVSTALLTASWGALFTAIQTATQHTPIADTFSLYAKLVMVLVSIAGFLASAGSCYSIRAAQRQINCFDQFYSRRLSPGIFEKPFDRIVGEHKNHVWGHLVPTGLPVMFCVVWGVLFVFSFSLFLRSIQ